MNPIHLNDELKTAERKLKQMDLMDVETQIPDSDDYYQKLHDRIMLSVESLDVKPPPRFQKPKDLLKRHWRQGLFLITTGAFAAVVGIHNVESANSQFKNNHAVVKFQNEDQLIGLLKSAPEVLDNTVLSSYATQDLMSDGIYSNIDLTKELIDSM